MEIASILYTFVLAALYAAVYLFLYFFLPVFFQQKTQPLAKRSADSIGLIVLLSLAIFVLTAAVQDQEISNRLLHIFGGGFLALTTCFLVVRDTKLKITKFQFFVISFLIVTALGVGNELLEFLLQSTTGTIFSPTPTDTWLDLLSNTIGALLASACLIPLFPLSHLKKETV